MWDTWIIKYRIDDDFDGDQDSYTSYLESQVRTAVALPRRRPKPRRLADRRPLGLQRHHLGGLRPGPVRGPVGQVRLDYPAACDVVRCAAAPPDSPALTPTPTRTATKSRTASISTRATKTSPRRSSTCSWPRLACAWLVDGGAAMCA
jgi:hypothetical protein